MNVRRDGDAYVAEEGGEVVGTLRREEGRVLIELETPREGVALGLLRAAAADDVPAGEEQEPGSFGSVHLQTDDQAAVVKLVERLVPRVLASDETAVSPARNGWVAVYDAMADRDPAKLRALGRELSNGSGHITMTIGVEDGRVVHLVAMERARVMDEYVSVPSIRQLAPGDAIALRANPTVLSRLTGAEPATIRAVLRTAESPDELAPAPDLIREVGGVLGLDGTDHGFDDAREVPGVVVVPHK